MIGFKQRLQKFFLLIFCIIFFFTGIFIFQNPKESDAYKKIIEWCHSEFEDKNDIQSVRVRRNVAFFIRLRRNVLPTIWNSWGATIFVVGSSLIVVGLFMPGKDE